MFKASLIPEVLTVLNEAARIQLKLALFLTQLARNKAAQTVFHVFKIKLNIFLMG